MLENFQKLVTLAAPWALAFTLQTLAVQYLFVVAAGLFHLYQILGMRGDSVKVISHERIWFGVVLTALVGLGYYRLILWLHPWLTESIPDMHLSPHHCRT